MIDICLCCTKFAALNHDTSSENKKNSNSNDQTRVQMPIQMYHGVKHEIIPEEHPVKRKIIRISRTALNRFIDSQPRVEQITHSYWLIPYEINL